MEIASRNSDEAPLVLVVTNLFVITLTALETKIFGVFLAIKGQRLEYRLAAGSVGDPIQAG